MGCHGSKLEEQPAVVLCKARCSFLEQAVRLRFEFAESQLAYVQSLGRVGQSFHFLLLHTESPDSAPILSLPVHRKGEANVSSKHVTFHSHSHSHSGSHLEFHSDSDSDSDISHLHLHDHDESSPPLVHQDLDLSGVPSTILHMSYMKSTRPTTSVVYEQRPVTSESVFYFGPGEGSSHPYYMTSNPYSYPGYHGYPVSSGAGNYGYGEYSSQPRVDISAAPSTSKPPPSPPRASGWDFFNLFEGNEYYGSHMTITSSRNSKDASDEGIPDLEEEDEVAHLPHGRSSGYGYQNEVVKEVLPKHPNNYPSGSSSGSVIVGEEVNSPSVYETVRREDAAEENLGGPDNGEKPIEYEVHVVEKKVVGGVSDEATNRRPRGSLDVSQVVSELKSQFATASASCGDVLHLLEPGQQLHRPRSHASRLLLGVAPTFSLSSSLSSLSKPSAHLSSSDADKANRLLLEIDEELAIRSKNLSSTLSKLFMWEKKLYLEVKAEEKLRVSHEKNCKKLKRMDERGAESLKVGTTRNLIRTLSTKMRMAIQVVDKISIAINKIRDEELWPQLLQLIQGLTKMWKSMLECHHIQCEAVRDARNVGSLGTTLQANDAYVEAVNELVKWASAFSSWIVAQKSFAMALNNWLVKCIHYEPEETVDGVVPFSPGRLGAPPVFVICNQWAQTIDSISEKEVLEAMYTFTIGVLNLSERSSLDSHKRVVTNKDLERKERSLERQDVKIQKEINTLEKQIVRIAEGNVLTCIEDVEFRGEPRRNLQQCLQRIFDAMEGFMSKSVKVYEELLQRAEEGMAAAPN